MATCFYALPKEDPDHDPNCLTEADPNLPTLVPHCSYCWSVETPSVKARYERDHQQYSTIEEALEAKLHRY